jgi:hypothetical protein
MKELGRCWRGAGLATALIVAVVGCRQEPTTVKGTVTLDGRPLAIKKGMRGTVIFQPAKVDGNTFNGMINSNGEYELAGGASTSVNPGAYWVAVSAVEIIPPSDDYPEPRGRRITPASYASATDSGFRVQVEPGSNVVNLELRSPATATAEVEGQAEPHADSPAESGPGIPADVSP